VLCRPDEDDTQPSLLEKIVDRAQLCSNLKLKMQNKFRDSLLFMVSAGSEEESKSKF